VEWQKYREGSVKKSIKNLIKIFFKKKKIGITTGLLFAFLITGKIGFATNEQIEELESKVNNTRQELLNKIFSQKSEIEQLPKYNEERLKESKIRYIDLVSERDWYSKPWDTGYF
jgi:hypothetical protein